jgi:hypothetical protein
VQSVIAGGLVLLTVTADRLFAHQVTCREWVAVALAALGLASLAATLEGTGDSAHSDYQTARLASFLGIVIAVTSVAANSLTICGGPIVFAEPFPAQPLGVVIRLSAFALVIVAAALTPAPITVAGAGAAYLAGSKDILPTGSWNPSASASATLAIDAQRTNVSTATSKVSTCGSALAPPVSAVRRRESATACSEDRMCSSESQ